MSVSFKMNGKNFDHHGKVGKKRGSVICYLISPFSCLNWRVLHLLVKVSGELNLALENLLVDGHRVVVVEGINAGQHLVGQDSERPPVDGFAVTLVKEHLWCQVLGCTAQCVCARLAILCETEVCQL